MARKAATKAGDRTVPTNVQVLNLIRKNASQEYRDRIPTATKTNVAEIAEFLWNSDTSRFRNEFISSLVNRIGEIVVRSRRWTDPFKQFKKKDVPFGSSVEDIGIGLIKGHTRDYNRTAELLRVNKPYVATAFVSTTRDMTYTLTIDEPKLMRAFLNEYGLSDFVAGLLDSQINSDELDEYLTVHAMLAEHDKVHGIFRVQIPDLNIEDDPDIERKAKNVLRKLQTLAGKLQFMKSDYLALDCPKEIKTFSPMDKLCLFATSEFVSAENVEALAVLFHLEKADIPYRIVIVDEFMIPDVHAVLLDEDALIMHDQFHRNDYWYNPSVATANHYLHHTQIIGFSPFLPIIAFTTGDPTKVPSVEVESTDGFKLGMINPTDGSITQGLPADIRPGSSIQLIGWEKLNMAGKDWKGNDVSYVDLDGATISVARKLDTSTAADATAGSDPWVDKFGVLHVPYDYMVQIDGSVPPETIDIEVAATSAVFGDGTETLDTIKISGKVSSAGDATLYQTNEFTRAVYKKYMSLREDPDQHISDGGGDTPNP